MAVTLLRSALPDPPTPMTAALAGQITDVGFPLFRGVLKMLLFQAASNYDMDSGYGYITSVTVKRSDDTGPELPMILFGNGYGMTRFYLLEAALDQLFVAEPTFVWVRVRVTWSKVPYIYTRVAFVISEWLGVRQASPLGGVDHAFGSSTGHVSNSITVAKPEGVLTNALRAVRWNSNPTLDLAIYNADPPPAEQAREIVGVLKTLPLAPNVGFAFGTSFKQLSGLNPEIMEWDITGYTTSWADANVPIYAPDFVDAAGDADCECSTEASASVIVNASGRADCVCTAIANSVDVAPVRTIDPVTTPLDPIDPRQRLVVRTMKWGINQAKIFEVDHVIKTTDYQYAWNLNDVLVYKDPDLGTLFVGRLYEKERRAASGEGWTYRLCDVYRLLQKHPVRLACPQSIPYYGDPYLYGTTRVHVMDNVKVVDAVDAVTRCVRQPGWNFLPAGVVFDGIDGSTIELYKALDKGGMTIAQWLDDILDQTPGWCASGFFTQVLSDYWEGLRVYDYYAQPDVTLDFGTYDAHPIIPELPFLVEGTIKESTDDKYYCVLVEGGGKWRRKVDQWVAPTYCTISPQPVNPPTNTTWKWKMRFYFDETNISGWHYDGQGNCKNAIHAEMKVHYSEGDPPIQHHNSWVFDGLPTRDMDHDSLDCVPNTNPPYINPRLCKWYVELVWVQGGVGPGGTQPPPAPIIADQKFSYTVYEGALLARAPSFAATPNISLVRQGMYVIQTPEKSNFVSPGRSYMAGEPPQQYWYEEPRNDDVTAELQDIANRYYERMAARVNLTGTMTIHIKGNTGNLRPGMRVANFGPNTNVRILSLSYDFISRNITLELSDVPLRDAIQQRKDVQVDRKKKHANWNERAPARLAEPCIKEVSLTSTEDCECIIVDEFQGGGYT